MKKFTQKILFGLVGKIAAVSLAVFCIALFNSNSKAQTLLVNYDFASAVAGKPCTATPLTKATGVTSIFTTSGTNEGTCTTTEGINTRSAFAENQDGNLAVSLNSSVIDAVNYFQFQLKGVSSFRAYKLYFTSDRSGPIEVQYSIDGSNFTSFIQLQKPITQIWFPESFIDLSSVTELNGQPTVYFRLVGKSKLNSTLYFSIDNFQVQAVSMTKSNKRVRITF